MYFTSTVSFVFATLVAASAFGWALLSGSPAGHAVALADTPPMTDAERSKLCGKLADEIKKAEKDYADLRAELAAIRKANPGLAGPTVFIKPLDDIAVKLMKLYKDQSDLCVLHFTMPPPPTATPRPPGGQPGMTNPGPAKTDSPTQKALRAMTKACNELRSDWGQIPPDLRQLQASPVAPALGQTRSWQPLQNDAGQIGQTIQLLCPPSGPNGLLR